jgi:hypothetical protein
MHTLASTVVRAVVNRASIYLVEAPSEHVKAGQDILRGQFAHKLVSIPAPKGIAGD